MNSWLDISLVALVVITSVAYAAYALGPQRLRDFYSRFATKYFGLRAARFFVESASGHSCRDCPASSNARKETALNNLGDRHGNDHTSIS